MKNKISILAFSLLAIILGCHQKGHEAQKTAVKPVSGGEKLAKVYCATCHAYPEPALLDLGSWQNHVLPRMGYMLGIYPNDSVRETLFEKGPGGERVRTAAVFPKDPVIKLSTWEEIKQFYLENAPEKLPQPSLPEVNRSLGEMFEVREPAVRLSPPSTTLVKMSSKEIYIGDAHTQSILKLDSRGQVLNAAKVKEGAVWLEETDHKLWVAVMGSFSPTAAPPGMILSLPKDGTSGVEIPIKDLQRPVHFQLADLDKDGLEDVVVCEFGKWTGGLSWFRNQGDGNYEKHIISAWPGATKAYVRDMNKDGIEDVVALFGQGNEGIDIFYGRGDGQFTPQRILQFSPSQGSSFFSLLDWENDGDLDIIYTAGDNADFSPVLKPYHGIYIYINQGDNHFEQGFFQPMNGAYAAVARDFDHDGDRDLAAISFFPDFTQTPALDFMYLENKGGLDFATPNTFKEALPGRWIVMDAADYDGDGDDDLILGSLAFEVVPPMGLVEKWAEQGIPYVILENKTK